MDSRTVTAEAPGKRPRSDSGEFPPIASKVPKTHSNHLQINYLARQYSDNLPLVSLDDTMPAIIHLIGEYDGVLQRHESIAGNLGACPLGPILIKRFERLFDGPPRVLKSHGKDTPNVTWLDVVEFAKAKPEQFNLEKTRNGVRVCQFYTKQSRVEISEEDFVLIDSGMPQKMIPPQPIIEDEEKELGALEILEKNLQQIVQIADQVSARARQLNHRLKNRKTAIVARRENDVTLHTSRPPAAHSQTQPHLPQQRSMSPVWRDANGNTHNPLNGNRNGNSSSNAQSPSTGFVAVNAARHGAEGVPEENNLSSQFLFSHSNTDNVTIINGTSIKGASPTTRAELMKKFFTTQDRQVRGAYEEAAGSSNRQSSRPRPRVSEGGEYNMFAPSPATVAIPNTPTSLLPPPKSHHHEKDDGGPFKIEMVARMEELQRGDRIMPPCDRCRRLHMDCLKNLTACMGCTKKHAKCSWRDVKEEELREAQRADRENAEASRSKDTSGATSPTAALPEQAPPPPPTTIPTPASAPTPAALVPEPERPREGPTDVNVRRESAPIAAPVARPPVVREVSPRRAVSEIQGSHSHPFNHERHDRHDRHDRQDRRISIHRVNEPSREDEVPDALRQAILDTYNDHHRVAAAAKASVREVSNERERERDREREQERDRKLVRA
ncbi:Zn(II)2Cys6 transcription factor domain-containing protein [Aspergillus undulatus]|uniref:Zn(II)2Cys6 transcription factor domain-containing protein n=1 Tax=Aspergillus undulatus TaxID=1810928 RepID=UPI003CCD331C